MNEADEIVAATNARVNELPCVEYLRECFSCDPETGVLIWRRRPVWHFTKGRTERVWNGKFAGRVAGSGCHRMGYTVIAIENRKVYAHRIVWTLFNGPLPVGMSIDHINGVTSDNRLVNLRLATHSQNTLHSKRKVSRHYFRGLPAGVAPSLSKWMARFRNRYLGTFETIEEASLAYQQAYQQAAGEFAHKEVTGPVLPSQ